MTHDVYTFTSTVFYKYTDFLYYCIYKILLNLSVILPYSRRGLRLFVVKLIFAMT